MPFSDLDIALLAFARLDLVLARFAAAAGDGELAAIMVEPAAETIAGHEPPAAHPD